MRDLNTTVSVTSVTDTLTWENAMDIGRVNDCVVYIRNNTHTEYLINGAYFIVIRDPKIAAMTNGVSGRGGGPILLVSGSVISTKRKLTVYNHWGVVVLLMHIPQDQTYLTR